MPTLKTSRELAADAEVFGTTFQCIAYRNAVYIPVDYETNDWSVTPPPERRAWMPMNQEALCRSARVQFDTTFKIRDGMDYEYMVMQSSDPYNERPTGVLIKTEDGLRVLKGDGKLHEPDGTFVPNLLPIKLNTNPDDMAEVRKVIIDWLGSEEEATALLRHAATILAPHWSAIRYVLLIGDGRNGKSLFMKMLSGLVGFDNVSNVSRQAISKESTHVAQLNGKLLNIVYDGPAEYLKDSGAEKTLIAGESISVKVLYRSIYIPVQTNALFIEGLNREPKSSDKSSALQERIVRFQFKNKYPDDLMFQAHMLSERMLGALLAVLLDHYVKEEDKSVMLAPTAKALELKQEHMVSNSLPLQFLQYLYDAGELDLLLGKSVAQLAMDFSAWRPPNAQYGQRIWSENDVRSMFNDHLIFGRKSKRLPNMANPTKIRFVEAIKATTVATISHSEGDEDATTPLVSE